MKARHLIRLAVHTIYALAAPLVLSELIYVACLLYQIICIYTK